jgi:energy-coupling factor transporter ATP-binding protein EcfA2
MLTKLTIRNFKLFGEVELELGDRVVLIGPNNAGKTSALQALALWDIGVKRWSEKRGSGNVPEKRPGVTINRRDLITVPVPAANLLWRDLHTQESSHLNGGTRKVNIEVTVEGIADGAIWRCGLEFYYANEESFYCRPLRVEGGGRMEVPKAATDVQVAYLPPMSGLGTTESRLDEGAVNVALGEGRTAEVLRNLCYRVLQGPDGETKWRQLAESMSSLFGIELEQPKYIRERGEIVMAYRERSGVQLDISASGRGQQQTLLLLAHMIINPGAVLMLDEPDAHLEILRQRQIYQIITKTAAATGGQILAASHSEVLLNEAAGLDIVIAFVGKPHRIDDRGSQVLKALKDIGFDHYYQAEEKGWVLYLEGSSDLAILSAFADRLGHAAKACLQRPFVQYVANQPMKAREHFHGLRAAKNDLVGVALYDHLSRDLPMDAHLQQLMWAKREIENYLCQPETLLAFAESEGRAQAGELFAISWRDAMQEAIREIEAAFATLGSPSPWGPEVKASEEFLDRLFARFYAKLGLPNLRQKTDYHLLVSFVPIESIDDEVRRKLDAIAGAAAGAQPRRS